MKIYKRKFSALIKTYFINILAAFIFLVVLSQFIDILFAMIATFFLYSYLMIRTFIHDKVEYQIEKNMFRKVRGKKTIFEYDTKNIKVKKSVKKSVVGYSEQNIIIGNNIIDCSVLDNKDFEDMYKELSK